MHNFQLSNLHHGGYCTGITPAKRTLVTPEMTGNKRKAPVSVILLIPQASLTALKRKHRPKMVSFMLRAHDTKSRLNAQSICSFSLSQICNLNEAVWNFLVKNNEAISHAGPLHPPQKLKASYMIKHFSFYQPPKKDVLAPK